MLKRGAEGGTACTAECRDCLGDRSPRMYYTLCDLCGAIGIALRATTSLDPKCAHVVVGDATVRAGKVA